MIKLSSLKTDYQKAGAMHEQFAPCSFVGESVVLTKRQDLFTVLRVPGIDPECLDLAQLDYIVRRFEAALRILGPEYRVYQYILKQDSPDLPVAEHPGPLAERRQEWLSARAADLFSVRLFLVVLRERRLQDVSTARTITGNLLSWFSAKQTLAVSRKELDREVELLSTAVHSLAVQLQDTARPVVLGRVETMSFLRRLVNCTPWKADTIAAVQDFHVDQQIAQSGIECWPRHLKQDDQLIKVLSLVELPAQTFSHLLRGLLSVPCGFVIVTEWQRQDNHKMRREIDKKRRHYHFAKTSMMSYVGGGSDTKEHEILIDDSKTAVVEELNRCLREMEVNENFFGKFSLTIALYHHSEATLKRSVAKMAEVFSTHDAKLTEETYNMLNGWLAMMPGNYANNFRSLLLLNTNYADLSFLFAPAAGDRQNSHLNRPCLAVVETREAAPYFLNLHYQDVGHTLILGSIGSGKSFLVNFLTASYQEYQPYTVIFDLGGSYQKLTREFGGSYLHVGKQGGFTINPFSLPPTKENLEFLFSFIRVLVEGKTYQMDAEELKDLHRAIADLYELEPETRTLSALAQSARRSYAKLLDEWIGEGRLAQYFDNREDTLSIARFQTFDFEGMDQAEVLEPLLFYILHRANASIYDRGQHATPKLFVFDEAWRFFRNPTTRGYIVEALKTWRKRNAVMILATQSSDDLLKEEMLSVIAESCFTKMFLANPGMDAAVYRETFHLNETEANLISRLVPKQQFLLKRPDLAKVLNLNVDPEALRIFGNAQ